MSTYFSIAALQLALEPSDNLSLLIAETKLAKLRFPWVDMVIYPELAVHGVSHAKAEPQGGDTENALAKLAAELGIWLLPGSLYQRVDGVLRNVSPVINPAGEVVARYSKMFPFLPYEKGVEPGQAGVVFDVPDVGRFGVSICYDMWFPETTRSLVCQGAEVILHPTLTNTVDRDVELSIARANAAMNQVYFVDINAAGALGVGQSCIVGPDGQWVHKASVAQEVITAELDLGHLRRCRERGSLTLGQPLKSFRDHKPEFPAYSESSHPALDALGEMAVPSVSKPKC
jgi:predicted amidohydrolase